MAKKKTKEPVQCLYHDELKQECICIRPVTTEEDLKVRKKNRRVINRWHKKLGLKPI